MQRKKKRRPGRSSRNVDRKKPQANKDGSGSKNVKQATKSKGAVERGGGKKLNEQRGGVPLVLSEGGGGKTCSRGGEQFLKGKTFWGRGRGGSRARPSQQRKKIAWGGAGK